MKKLFTLVSMAFMAMSMNAQDVYDAIVNGKLAPEFAAVSGENGGVANNSADGKSIINITKGKATVTAVGGTTPANAAAGGQDITIGEVIDAEAHTYKIASVNAWNDISWGLKSQGDIDFWYVTGTGNPYVDMNAVENSKDGEWQGTYKADYVFYNPDGSLGMPVTGLYYKFTASAAGAFMVKVWANKGNRQTFVVNANTKKAERLLASGYINGVNDAGGKKKFLTVAQIDSVHHSVIWGAYEKAVAEGTKTPDELADMKTACEADEAAKKYVIGNGGQNFWGWLTFDVEAGEEYWVFQHSSQIGFGGFEFYEGKTAEDIIKMIEPDYVYATNFSTYEDPESGQRVTWNGEKAVGNGKFATTEEEGVAFGEYFSNDGTGVRASYCLLPEDVLAHSVNTQSLTIGVWVRAQAEAASFSYYNTPLFTAYGAAPVNGENTWPMMAFEYRGLLQVNCAGWSDYTDTQNVAGKNTIYAGDNDPLADKFWHYYTAVFDGENAKVYIDGALKNEWNNDGTANTQKGLFSNGADLKYVCLGGNQAWGWADNDAPFDFARMFIKNKALSAGEIQAKMNEQFPGWNEQGSTGIEAVKTVSAAKNAAMFNIAGQRVANGFKGLVIMNGKKFFVK